MLKLDRTYITHFLSFCVPNKIYEKVFKKKKTPQRSPSFSRLPAHIVKKGLTLLISRILQYFSPLSKAYSFHFPLKNRLFSRNPSNIPLIGLLSP